MKILFVCLGNICRSPLAEAIFLHKVKTKGFSDKFLAASCGTANYHVGDLPDPRTIRNAGKNDVGITHIGRQLSEDDLIDFDLILAMDSSNLNNILKLKNASRHLQKIKLVRDYDPQGKGNVPDPYYGVEQDFQEVFEILDRSIENLIKNLKA